jgi:hypothetical protein
MEILAKISRSWIMSVSINMIDTVEQEYWSLNDDGKFQIDFDMFWKNKEPFISSAIKIAIKAYNIERSWKVIDSDEIRKEWMKIS